MKEVPWNPTPRDVSDVLDALGTACVLLPGDVRPPAQLSGKHRPGTFVSCANGLLDVDTRQIFSHTPRLFNLVSVPFDYDPRAPKPKQWLDFLDELWPDDQESIATLQEWFGYVLSGRTDLEKALLVVGPKRGGKGTINGVLEGLIGKSNTVGVTLTSLTNNFGLQPLIGKSLAFVSDARLDPKASAYLVVERLLNITGRDPITIDRKNRKHWEGHSPARFMVSSNELPRFTDASDTIVSRFVTLKLTRSWFGKEDSALAGKLAAELPGILNWALEGLDQLNERGYFVEPKSSKSMVREMSDASSPHSAFVRERCDKDPERRVRAGDLYEAWRTWCGLNGRDHPGTVQTFGIALRAAIPGLRIIRPRDSETGEQVRTYEGIGLKTEAGAGV